MTAPKSASTVEAIVDAMVDTVNPLQVRLTAVQAERDNYHGRMDEALAKVKELTAYWTERADKLTAERDRLLAQIVAMKSESGCCDGEGYCREHNPGGQLT